VQWRLSSAAQLACGSLPLERSNVHMGEVQGVTVKKTGECAVAVCMLEVQALAAPSSCIL